MAAGVLFALTLPGLVILLVVVATAEHLWSRAGRRSLLLRRQRHALSAGGLDVFSAALVPGGHCLALSRPSELADLLESYLGSSQATPLARSIRP